jgi:glycosyltransferase involved in cell wall biosynthesis
MRVLMLSKACIVGIYQRKLELIAQRGIDLLTLVPPSWRDERGEQPLERVYTQGYTLQDIPIMFNGDFHLHWYPTLGRLMREFQPHIVHIAEEAYNAATWHALWLARRQKARTLFFTWQNIERNYPPPFSWGEAWTLRHIDHAMGGTQSAIDVLHTKGYHGPTSVIPQFGTDPELFQPASVRPERPFTIGYLGRLIEEKGVQLLVDAAAHLMGEWRLRFVGGGPLREALGQQAQQLGIADRLTFVGQVPSTDMPSQYHAIDVLVLPSLTRTNWKEQFGRVIVEAMASGVPVIGSDSGAIPDVIGDAGVIVPEGNREALTQALQCLLDQPAERDRLAQAGRAHVLQHYTHDQVAAATVEVYRGLLK